MNYEKKYKDVLAKAREIHRNEAEKRFDMEWLFPELKESEDKRIRKALIEMVHDTTGDELWVDYNVHKEDALAWLEKQGQTFTKKDVDDAYLKGICDAKQELEKQGEQKTAAWSKDDEAMFQSCTGAIWAADYYLYEDKQDMEAWLKSIKNRIGG